MNLNEKIKFARFGGLSSVKQKGYDSSMPGFHSPPCKRGIYAFVYPYYIPFLLGSSSYSGFDSKHNKMEYVKDKFGEFVVDDGSESNFMKEFCSIEKDGVQYKVKPKKVKVFEYSGEIWHHLDTIKPNQILQTKGSWYLSTYKDYCIALKKERHNLKRDTYRSILNYESGNNKNFKEMTVRGDFGWYNIDHLEVFIEKV